MEHKSKLKILLVSDYYPPNRHGGVGYVVESLRRSLSSDVNTVDVLTSGKQINNIDKGQIICLSNNIYVAALLNNFLIIKFLLYNRYDVIHLHQSLSTLFLPVHFILKILRITKTNILNTLHVDYCSESIHVKSEKYYNQEITPSLNELYKKCLIYPLHVIVDLIGYYLSDKVTALTSQNREDILKHYGLLYRRKIQIIPNGLDMTHFSTKNTIRNNSHLKLVYTGAFRSRKRMLLLISIIKTLKERSKRDIQLTIIGDGSEYYKIRLREIISQYGLKDNVTFLGKVDNKDLSEIYSLQDVFIITSSYEGFPVCILEALGSGLVIISHDHYGAKDMLSDQTAILLTSNSVDQNVSKILKNIEDVTRMKTLRDNSLDLVSNEYSIQHIARMYLACYKSLLT